MIRSMLVPLFATSRERNSLYKLLSILEKVVEAWRVSNGFLLPWGSASESDKYLRVP